MKGPGALIDRLNIRRDYTFIGAGPLNDRMAAAVLRHPRIVSFRNADHPLQLLFRQDRAGGIALGRPPEVFMKGLTLLAGFAWGS